MAKNVKISEDVPHDRLTRIAAQMGDAMEQHPELREADTAIIMVDNHVEHRGGMQVLGYDGQDPHYVLKRMISHAEAYAKAHDLPFAVLPSNAIGAQG